MLGQNHLYLPKLVSCPKDQRLKGCIVELVGWDSTRDKTSFWSSLSIRNTPSKHLSPLIRPRLVWDLFDRERKNWSLSDDLLLALGISQEEMKAMMADMSSPSLLSICLTVFSTQPEYKSKLFQSFVRSLAIGHKPEYIQSAFPKWYAFLTQHQSFPTATTACELQCIRMRLHRAGNGELSPKLAQWCQENNNSVVDAMSDEAAEPWSFQTSDLPADLRAAFAYQYFEPCRGSVSMSVQTSADVQPRVQKEHLSRWRQQMQDSAQLVWMADMDFAFRLPLAPSSLAVFWNPREFPYWDRLMPHSHTTDDGGSHSVAEQKKDQDKVFGFMYSTRRSAIRVLMVVKTTKDSAATGFPGPPPASIQESKSEEGVEEEQGEGWSKSPRFFPLQSLIDMLLEHWRQKHREPARRLWLHVTQHPEFQLGPFLRRILQFGCEEARTWSRDLPLLCFWSIWATEAVAPKAQILSLFWVCLEATLARPRDEEVYLRLQRSQSEWKKIEEQAYMYIAEEGEGGKEEGDELTVEDRARKSVLKFNQTQFDALLKGNWDWATIQSWAGQTTTTTTTTTQNEGMHRVRHFSPWQVEWWFALSCLAQTRHQDSVHVALAVWAHRWGFIPRKRSLRPDTEWSGVFQSNSQDWSMEEGGGMIDESSPRYPSAPTSSAWQSDDYVSVPIPYSSPGAPAADLPFVIAIELAPRDQESWTDTLKGVYIRSSSEAYLKVQQACSAHPDLTDRQKQVAAEWIADETNRGTWECPDHDIRESPYLLGTKHRSPYLAEELLSGDKGEDGERGDAPIVVRPLSGLPNALNFCLLDLAHLPVKDNRLTEEDHRRQEAVVGMEVAGRSKAKRAILCSLLKTFLWAPRTSPDDQNVSVERVCQPGTASPCFRVHYKVRSTLRKSFDLPWSLWVDLFRKIGNAGASQQEKDATQRQIEMFKQQSGIGEWLPAQLLLDGYHTHWASWIRTQIDQYLSSVVETSFQQRIDFRAGWLGGDSLDVGATTLAGNRTAFQVEMRVKEQLVVLLHGTTEWVRFSTHTGEPLLSWPEEGEDGAGPHRTSLWLQEASVDAWTYDCESLDLPPGHVFPYTNQLPGEHRVCESLWIWTPMKDGAVKEDLTSRHSALFWNHSKDPEQKEVTVDVATEGFRIHSSEQLDRSMSVRDSRWWDQLAQWTVAKCSHVSSLRMLTQTILEALLHSQCHLPRRNKRQVALWVRAQVNVTDATLQKQYVMAAQEVHQWLWSFYRLGLLTAQRSRWGWTFEQLEQQVLANDERNHFYTNANIEERRGQYKDRPQSLHVVERWQPFLNLDDTHTCQWSYFLSRCLALYRKTDAQKHRAQFVREGQHESGRGLDKEFMTRPQYDDETTHVNPHELTQSLKLWIGRAETRSEQEAEHIRYAIWKWVEHWPKHPLEQAANERTFQTQTFDYTAAVYPWTPGYLWLIGHWLMWNTSGLVFRPGVLFDVGSWKIHPRMAPSLLMDLRRALLTVVLLDGQAEHVSPERLILSKHGRHAQCCALEQFQSEHDQVERFQPHECAQNLATAQNALLAEESAQPGEGEKEDLGMYMALREREARSKIKHLQLKSWQMQDQGHLLLREMQYGAACLSHETGMGKTIITLLHLLAVPAGRRKQQQQHHGPSLIITPIISNYQLELIKSTVFDRQVSYYIHHPSLKEHCVQGERSVLPHCFTASDADSTSVLRKYELVITTYTALLNEWKLKQTKSPLWRILWRYVAVDEASHIKNADSDTFRAVQSLQSEFRLAVTATPFDKKEKSMHSLMRFMNVAPYSFPDWIRVKGKTDTSSFLAALMLRRKKRDLISTRRIDVRVQCPLTPLEEEWNRILQAVAQQLLARNDVVSFSGAGNGNNSGTRSANLFVLLTKTLTMPWLWCRDSGVHIQQDFVETMHRMLGRYKRDALPERQILPWTTRHLNDSKPSSSAAATSDEQVVRAEYTRDAFQALLKDHHWLEEWEPQLACVDSQVKSSAAASATTSSKYSMCRSVGKNIVLFQTLYDLIVHPKLLLRGEQTVDDRRDTARHVLNQDELAEVERELVVFWLETFDQRRKRLLLNPATLEHGIAEEKGFFAYEVRSVRAHAQPPAARKRKQGSEEKEEGEDDAVVVVDEDEEEEEKQSNQLQRVPYVRFFSHAVNVEEERVEENADAETDDVYWRWQQQPLPPSNDVELLCRRGWIELRGPDMDVLFSAQEGMSNIEQNLLLWHRVQECHSGGASSILSTPKPAQYDLVRHLTPKQAAEYRWHETQAWREHIEPYVLHQSVFAGHSRVTHAAEKAVVFGVHDQALEFIDRQYGSKMLAKGLYYTVVTHKHSYGYMSMDDRLRLERDGPMWGYRSSAAKEPSLRSKRAKGGEGKQEAVVVADQVKSKLVWVQIESKSPEPIYRWSYQGDGHHELGHESYMYGLGVGVLFTSFISSLGANLTAGRNQIFLDVHNDIEKNLQAEGRVDRLSLGQDMYLYSFESVYSDGTPTLEHIKHQVQKKYKAEAVSVVDAHVQKTARLKESDRESAVIQESVEYLKLYLFKE